MGKDTRELLGLAGAATLGAIVSSVLFARGELRPWIAVPVGLVVAIVAAIAFLRALGRR